MAFQFSEQHYHDFYVRGITVFRGIIPTSLIRDLRRSTDRGRELAREKHGPLVQRIQPVAEYDMDQRPFRDYIELPSLRDAVTRILSPEHSYGRHTPIAVLLEPADRPWTIGWHRDARDLLDDEEWAYYTGSSEIGNQINCPLYEDTCTWFVPGSHLRADLPSEKIRKRPSPKDYADLGEEEAERLVLEYSRSMPGGERLLLDAGDFALYRPWAWHLGTYFPNKKRATIHDSAFTARGAEMWLHRLKQGKKPAVTQVAA